VKYRTKLFIQWFLGLIFKVKESFRGNIVFASKIVGGKRIMLGKKVYISENVRIISEKGGLIEIGDGSKIGAMSIIEDRGGFIKVGKKSFINSFSVLYGHGGLTIGDNVIMATGVTIIPANHKFEDLNIPIANQGENKKGVIIEDGVWIGAGVIILDGVTIGRGSVIGAGAVVTKNIPPMSIAMGVPARVTKNRQ